MMPMDPTDAQIILVGVKENNSQPSIGYRRALETIAGMTIEYAIAHLDRDGNIDLMDDGYGTLAAAQRRRDQIPAKVRPHARIMRRTVGPWEEA